jgi:hypothetical protein
MQNGVGEILEAFGGHREGAGAADDLALIINVQLRFRSENR